MPDEMVTEPVVVASKPAKAAKPKSAKPKAVKKAAEKDPAPAPAKPVAKKAAKVGLSRDAVPPPAVKAKAVKTDTPTTKKMRRIAELLKGIGDPTRIALLYAVKLSDGQLSVADLIEEIGLTSQPAVSHHLSLLKARRLIEPIRQGKQNFYKLTSQGEVVYLAIESFSGQFDD